MAAARIEKKQTKLCAKREDILDPFIEARRLTKDKAWTRIDGLEQEIRNFHDTVERRLAE
jgi:hypothetical protein